jgi:alpha-D-ribose 1-methylphosphonate 5-triphosphate synthase subunit PhnI
MATRRRISAIYKDLPGGQILGPSPDYTQRLLEFQLAADGEVAGAAPAAAEAPVADHVPGAFTHLDREGLIEPSPAAADADAAPTDITRAPVAPPVPRDAALQMLARGDEGYLLGLAYSTQRGFGGTHPFAGEIRVGEVAVGFVPPELGFEVEIAELTVTECQMVNQFQGSEAAPPQFTRGYGLSLGHTERKAMAMALLDRSLRGAELGEPTTAPAQDPEFVLAHADNVEASGFVQHLKLPHYVDFQSELVMLRELRARFARAADGAAEDTP